MSSEINPLGASGVSARLVPEQKVAALNSGPTSEPAARDKPNVKLHKTSPASFDPLASRENIKEAVDILNTQMTSNKRGIGFTVNNDSNTPIVTVRNTSTGEVVRQIPNDVVIKLATGLDNSKGIIHNKQV